MASYHLTAKIGAKGKAAPHSAYIARDGKYSGNERYEDIEATGYGNMPAWAAHNVAHFWQAADEHERANGSTYRELEVALPRELNKEQRLALLQDFISQELGDKHAYQYAIHTPNATIDKGEQPHAHIMYSERIRDSIERDPEQYFKRYNSKQPERGGAKKHSGGKRADELKAELLATRERWAVIQNKHLEKHGHSERVNHLSLEDQGIERTPEKHIGIKAYRMTASEKAALVELRTVHAENTQAQAEAAPIVEKHKKQKLVNDFAKSAADKFKNRLAEKAQAEKAERDRIKQEQIRKAYDEMYARADKEKARQQEQQRQAEREQIERKAREETERNRQAEQQAELAKIEALKAQQKTEQEAQRRAERKAKDNDLEL